jgi:N-acetylneuraminic acid mutarotase
MLNAECNPLVVQFANKVYAFGGWRTRVTQEFDPTLNKWRMRSQMPGCCCGSAVALGDKIYVVGGIERVCYSYDPENDEWKVLSKPTHEYFTNAATVWKGKILVGDKEHVEEYDPVDDRWSNRDELLPDGDINKMFLYASCSF